MFAISGLHCGLLTFFCLTVASKSLPFLTWIVFFAFCQTYCTFTGPASRCGPPWFQCVSSIGAPFQNIENAGILKFSSNCIASASSPPQVLKDSKHITEPRTSSQAPNLNHPPWPCDIWVLSFQNIPKSIFQMLQWGTESNNQMTATFRIASTFNPGQKCTPSATSRFRHKQKERQLFFATIVSNVFFERRKPAQSSPARCDPMQQHKQV